MAPGTHIIAVRTAVNGALETARAEKNIGKSLEAEVDPDRARLTGARQVQPPNWPTC